MSDQHRPATCRNEMKEMGFPYPKSGCNFCGCDIRTGLACPFDEKKEEAVATEKEQPSFSLEMVDAVKVQFLKTFFEDDFPERGMKAWLVAVEVDQSLSELDKGYVCYNLWFDFADFESENTKYFRQVYHPNIHTKQLDPSRTLFTALEAGMYNPKYRVYYSEAHTNRPLEKLTEYLRIVE